MKYLFSILILFVPLFSFSQIEIDKKFILREAVLFTLGIASGYSNGVHEAINYRYHIFQNVHPNANPQFWNPDLSWKNKNKHTGIRRYLARTSFVWTTDGKHLTNGLDRFITASEVSIRIYVGRKNDWKYVLWSVLSMFVSRKIGFHWSFHGTYSAGESFWGS